MEYEDNQQKNKLSIILSIIALSLIVVCVVLFYYVYNKMDNTIKNIDVRVENVELKMDETYEEPTLSQGRVLIERTHIRDYIDQMPEPCTANEGNLLGFLDSASEDYVFENTDWGIRMNIPYNPGWGEGKFYVKPYDMVNDTIYFGSVFYRSEGCGAWSSQYRIERKPVESLDDLMMRLSQSIGENEIYTKVEHKKINGLDIVLVGPWGEMGSPYDTYLVGKKYMYQLFGHPLGAFPEELIETMELIDL